MLVDHCINKKELFIISHMKVIKFVENYCKCM